MKMIERWKSQTDFQKMVSTFITIAVIGWLTGILFTGPFYTTMSYLLFAVVSIVNAAVKEIKRYIGTIEFKIKDVPVDKR